MLLSDLTPTLSIMTSTAVHLELTASPPAPRPSFRQRLAARRLIRRAWSDLYADLDAQTTSRVDSWDRLAARVSS